MLTRRLAGLALLAVSAGCVSPLPEPPAPGEAPRLVLDTATHTVSVTDATPTPSALWNRVFLEAVRRKGPGPTVTARAAAILHGALYDVWAAYDPVAIDSTLSEAFQRPPEQNTEANKAEAMAHAAHMLLSAMFPEDRARFDRVMRALGHDPEPGQLHQRPAGLGRVVAMRTAATYRGDGSNWDDGFEDTSGYAPVNPSPLELTRMDRWTPENTPIDPEDPTPDQTYLTPHWGEVRPVALASGDALDVPPPEPFLLSGREGEVDLAAGTLTLDDGRVLGVSPELVGTVINPAFIAQAEEVVAASAALDDRRKLIAEFWEDNKDTSFPPGTWLTFAEYVSARDDRSLDEDAQMFHAVSVALFDASVASWGAKRHYDYVRPVRAIRALGRLGLIGRPGPEGNVIEAWAGPGKGTATIPAARFLSYQNPEEDPSPPFAEYPSGHSAFSMAAAEVLAAYTGNDRFGGSVTFPPGSSRFEPGITPAAPVTLSWPTFTAAAREAGASRIHGGIHFRDADRAGRALGREVGQAALAHVRSLAAGRRP